MFARILILRILRMAFSPQKLNPANKGFNMYANWLGIGRGQRSAKYKLRKHAQEAGTAKLSMRKYFQIYSTVCLRSEAILLFVQYSPPQHSQLGSPVRGLVIDTRESHH